MRWSENETFKFVTIYLKHENLWNPSDADYKLKHKRQETYIDIIAEFHASTGIMLSEPELRIKIKNLRSTYTQELTKIRQRSSVNSIYTPTIKWFSEWHACFSAIRKETDLLDEEKNFNGKRTDPFESDDYQSHVKCEPQDYSINRTRKIKRRRKTKQVITTVTIENTEMSVNANPTDDEFDLYGRYLAAQLRSMDIYIALKTQIEIQSIVSKARIASLSGT